MANKNDTKEKTKSPKDSAKTKTKSPKVGTQTTVDSIAIDSTEKENLTPNKQEPLRIQSSLRKYRGLRTTDSKRAGLTFPVARTLSKLRKGKLVAKHIQKGAGIYMAAVLEYLCAEILELAGDAAAVNKRARLIPRHILLAVENDMELKELLKTSIIAGGGKVPFIHNELLKMKSEPKRKKKSSAASAQVDLDDVTENAMEM